MVSMSAGSSGRAATHIGYVKQTQVAVAAPNHSIFKPTSPSCHLTAIPYGVVYQIGWAPILMSKCSITCSIRLSKDISYLSVINLIRLYRGGVMESL